MLRRIRLESLPEHPGAVFRAEGPVSGYVSVQNAHATRSNACGRVVVRGLTNPGESFRGSAWRGRALVPLRSALPGAHSRLAVAVKSTKETAWRWPQDPVSARTIAGARARP